MRGEEGEERRVEVMFSWRHEVVCTCREPSRTSLHCREWTLQEREREREREGGRGDMYGHTHTHTHTHLLFSPALQLRAVRNSRQS